MGMPFTYADLRRLDRYDEASPLLLHLLRQLRERLSRGVEIATVNRALMYAEGAITTCPGPCHLYRAATAGNGRGLCRLHGVRRSLRQRSRHRRKMDRARGTLA